MNIDRRIHFSFSFFLPLFAALVSSSIVLIPGIRTYLIWKTALGHGDKLTLTFGNFGAVVPREHLLSFAIQSNAMREQGTIAFLNAPGHLIAALTSQLIPRTPNWFPDALGPFTWRALSLPFFAIPAWIFAGRGIDGLVMSKRMRRFDLLLGSALLLLSATLSAGLRFGLSEAERTAGDLTVFYGFGFAWWTFLFGFPVAAWFRQKFERSH